jgi:hypothetical protein
MDHRKAGLALIEEGISIPNIQWIRILFLGRFWIRWGCSSSIRISTSLKTEGDLLDNTVIDAVLKEDRELGRGFEWLEQLALRHEKI